MFFEQSTRTFTSFNLAELRLGARRRQPLASDLSLSTKGETIEDTAHHARRDGHRVLVVRHPRAGFPAARSRCVRRARRQCRRRRARASDAGAARHLHAHRGVRRRSHGRTVAIVGDILHSRVAHSTIRGLAGSAPVVLVGPECFLARQLRASDGVHVERDFDAGAARVPTPCLAAHSARALCRDADFGRGVRRALPARRTRLAHARERPSSCIRPVQPRHGTRRCGAGSLPGWRYARQVCHGVFDRVWPCSTFSSMLIKGGTPRRSVATRFDALRDVRHGDGRSSRSAEHLEPTPAKGLRCNRRVRCSGIRRHARAPARARASGEGNDRDRYGGRGARRLYGRRVHAQYAAGAGRSRVRWTLLAAIVATDARLPRLSGRARSRAAAPASNLRLRIARAAPVRSRFPTTAIP